MTEILDRIDDVLADSRIQELDLIIDTLFGEPLNANVDFRAEFWFKNVEDRIEQSIAMEIHSGVSDGFLSWYHHPARAIHHICSATKLSMQERATTLIDKKDAIMFVQKADSEIGKYLNHCITSLDGGHDPLRWDVWLYLHMHGEDGLQP
jgi:hypothetical protein